jgi:hypothetical protein
MRYLQSTPFSVQMGDKNAQKNYRDNWEHTFGKPETVKLQPKKRETVVQHEAVAAR